LGNLWKSINSKIKSTWFILFITISNFYFDSSFDFKGQVIDYNKLSIWLQGTSEMSSFFSVNDNTENLMSEQVWNTWKNLYGAPNPVNFPNLPSNFITKEIFKDRVYRFEVKPVVKFKIERVFSMFSNL